MIQPRAKLVMMRAMADRDKAAGVSVPKMKSVTTSGMWLLPRQSQRDPIDRPVVRVQLSSPGSGSAASAELRLDDLPVARVDGDVAAVCPHHEIAGAQVVDAGLDATDLGGLCRY